MSFLAERFVNNSLMSNTWRRVKMLPTPDYCLTENQKRSVYDPAEDTFLLMDAIEAELEFLRSLRASLAVEIGVGSGVVSVFLAKALSNTGLVSIGTDRNEDACQATKETSRRNGVEMEVVRADLLSPLLSRLEGSIDILLFNPPYVPTEEDEGETDLARCWAGGERGTSTLERLLPAVPSLLSEKGAMYVVALKQNDIAALLNHNPRLKGSVVLERRAGIEYLYILKFQKIL